MYYLSSCTEKQIKDMRKLIYVIIYSNKIIIVLENVLNLVLRHLSVGK